LHRERPGIVLSADQIVFVQLVAYDAAQLRARIQGDAFDHHTPRIVCRIRLADIGIRNLGLCQLVFEQFHRVIGLGVNSIVDHHLEDQVKSALEVQSQMDSPQNGLLQRVTAEAFGQAKYAVQENKQDSDNDCALCK